MKVGESRRQIETCSEIRRIFEGNADKCFGHPSTPTISSSSFLSSRPLSRLGNLGEKVGVIYWYGNTGRRSWGVMHHFFGTYFHPSLSLTIFHKIFPPWKERTAATMANKLRPPTTHYAENYAPWHIIVIPHAEKIFQIVCSIKKQ